MTVLIASDRGGRAPAGGARRRNGIGRTTRGQFRRPVAGTTTTRNLLRQEGTRNALAANDEISQKVGVDRSDPLDARLTSVAGVDEQILIS